MGSRAPRAAGVASMAALVAVCTYGGEGHEGEAEPRREAVHARAEREAAPPVPEWRREIERAFERRVSFEFVETPLREAVQFLAQLTKVNVILDPRAATERGDVPITLKVRNMNLGIALDWILKLAELDYALRNEAVFVSTRDGLAGEVELRIYDVRDLTAPFRSSPAPRMSLTGTGPLPERGHIGPVGPFDPDDGFGGEGLGAATIAEMIMARVRPDQWAAELGTSIEERDGRLVVMQRPAVHAEVAAFLARLRAERALQVRVEARLVELPEGLLAEMLRLAPGGRDDAEKEWKPRGVVYIRRRGLEVLEGALQPGGDARLVAAAGLVCMNGQRLHTLEGIVRERKDLGDAPAGFEFRGTVLEVRPVVSFDRKYVRMELRLRRFEDADEPGEVRTWSFDSTVQCLDTDTVLVSGVSAAPAGPGAPGGADAADEPDPEPRRLAALVTPTILRLEPGLLPMLDPGPALARPRLARPRPRPAPPPAPAPPRGERERPAGKKRPAKGERADDPVF